MGQTGRTGYPGPKGHLGGKGQKGSIGEKGTRGERGPAGASGVPGRSGSYDRYVTRVTVKYSIIQTLNGHSDSNTDNGQTLNFDFGLYL